ncbi:unnamed protein product [Enterobius vermicularis]|uniref:JmjC domain-containing protein n=1 Tax=Enterobius vermicularis TaxID=51028 RepID=A0A0N4V324_ENTVE|nr:unnamed protein product [Enterobius vermicularis]
MLRDKRLNVIASVLDYWIDSPLQFYGGNFCRGESLLYGHIIFAEGGSITEANPICSAEKDTSGKSEAHSLEDENIEPVKKAKLEVDCAEELPFAYFEKQPTSASLLSRNEECETSISADGISAQKAEASKRVKESKESRDFRSLILSSENFKGWRLQEGPCAEKYYNPCLICSLNKNRKDKSDCRFYNRIRSVNNPKECRRLTIADARFFVDEAKASTLGAVITKDFWKANAVNGRRRVTRSSKQLRSLRFTRRDAHFAAYILQCVRSEFEKIVRREDQILQRDRSADGVFFSHSFNCNQICDVCNCSILNAHYCCIICGLELCWLCYDELNHPPKAGPFPKWLKRLFCLDGVEHIASMFHLGSFLPVLDIYRNVLKKADEQFKRYGIYSGGPMCNGNHGRRYFQEEKCYCPRQCVDIQASDGLICRIKDTRDPNAISEFKTHLASHVPIVVENVNEHPDFYPAVWSREALEKVISSQKKIRILDCQTLNQAYLDGKACTLSQFWKKFDSKHIDGEPYLKIKDFPETTMFAKVAPQQYTNYFNILPFLDYTQISLKDDGTGKLNLLNVFEEQENLVDPGPKAYVGVGLCATPHLASTPLHLDVSDSLNFLAVVQPPKELSRGDLCKVITERLDSEGVSESEKERALKRPDKAGALWKVFKPDDTLLLRNSIVDWKRQNGEKFDGDVIHNQDVVITPEFQSFLKQRGVSCYQFIQCEGDVVFVPSGSAHQVQNLNSCIKIAEDFVAVEGVEYVVKISDDLRRLKHGNDLIRPFREISIGQSRKETGIFPFGKHLRIDTVIYRACSTAVEALANFEPCLVPSSL